jgi:hypothetical protein
MIVTNIGLEKKDFWNDGALEFCVGSVCLYLTAFSEFEGARLELCKAEDWWYGIGNEDPIAMFRGVSCGMVISYKLMRGLICQQGGIIT